MLANKAGAFSLAEAYSLRAEQEERLGHRYTLWSLGLGVMTVSVIALVAILTLKEHTSVTTAAQRAAFGIPLALLAAYVNRLASAYRNQAWKLRHLELQLRTLNPFLAGLEDVAGNPSWRTWPFASSQGTREWYRTVRTMAGGQSRSTLSNCSLS
ncbi:MAG: hypothetical protein H0X28_02210 [Solirubrobacterales bacterium]|nr:hypothetical protein [Solirubrobacterales bacterium]